MYIVHLRMPSITLSLGDDLIGVHDAVWVEQLLNVSVDLQNLRGFLKTQVGGLVQSHSMLGTDTALVPGHFLEDKAVLELRPLFQDDVHVQVAVPNVPVPQDEGFSLIPQVIKEAGPFSDIKGDVISENPPLLTHCCHGHVFSDLPNLAILLIVIGHDGIIEVLHFFEKLIEFLSGSLHEKHVFIVLNFIEDARVEVPDDCMIGRTVDILQCRQAFAQSALDDWEALQNLLKLVSLKHHYLADVVDLLAQDVELGDHSNGALSANEQLLEVVPRVVLLDLGTKVQHVAIGHHCLQAQDVRSERTVLNHVFSAGIGRGVSANLA